MYSGIDISNVLIAKSCLSSLSRPRHRMRHFLLRWSRLITSVLCITVVDLCLKPTPWHRRTSCCLEHLGFLTHASTSDRVRFIDRDQFATELDTSCKEYTISLFKVVQLVEATSVSQAINVRLTFVAYFKGFLIQNQLYTRELGQAVSTRH